MGRRDRERIERIKAGEESPISKAASTPASKSILSFLSRGKVKQELSKGSVTEQTGKLDELVGTGHLPAGNLKAAIMRKAPGEMDKAIKKYRKLGKEVTVESLLIEVRSEPGFLKTCEKVGLDYKWFQNLAAERMAANGVTV